MPLQKTSELQISCVHWRYPQICIWKIRQKVNKKKPFWIK